MKAYQDKITKDQFVIISADTEQSQLQALKLGLATENLGQKPFEMGRQSTQMMYNYLMLGEKPIKNKYYLDFHLCNRTNYDTCTVNF